MLVFTDSGNLLYYDVKKSTFKGDLERSATSRVLMKKDVMEIHTEKDSYYFKEVEPGTLDAWTSFLARHVQMMAHYD